MPVLQAVLNTFYAFVECIWQKEARTRQFFTVGIKILHLSWQRGHANRPHPDTCTWPPVQCETTVSVFLGFTIQRAFTRRQFAPVLKEAHA